MEKPKQESGLFEERRKAPDWSVMIQRMKQDIPEGSEVLFQDL